MQPVVSPAIECSCYDAPQFSGCGRGAIDGWVALDFGAPRPGEGTVAQDMDAHKKYLVETLHVTFKS
jgi:hypothetical protein